MRVIICIFLFLGFGLGAQEVNRTPSLIEVNLYEGITNKYINENERCDTVIIDTTFPDIKVTFYIFMSKSKANEYIYKKNIYSVSDSSIVFISSNKEKKKRKFERDPFRILGSKCDFAECNSYSENYYKISDTSLFNDSFKFYVPIKDTTVEGFLFFYNHFYYQYSAYLYVYNKSRQLELRNKLIGFGESYKFSEIIPIRINNGRFTFFVSLSEPSGLLSYYFLTM